MGFFEVTGGFRLDSVLEGTPPRKGRPTPRRELKKGPSSFWGWWKSPGFSKVSK